VVRKRREFQGSIARRKVLRGLCGVGIGLPALARAQSDAGIASAPPAEGDRLVFAYGDRAGRLITPDALATDGRQVFAYPMEAGSGIVRDGTRLNQLIVFRGDPAGFSEETLRRSAAGVLAYSGVCSHTGCDVTDFDDESIRFQCPCHESQFDPSDGARVVGGPAPWQLAALPLQLRDGELVVAGAFEGRVGFQQPGLDPFGLGGI
jgi:rieske iron-sulfur protein